MNRGVLWVIGSADDPSFSGRPTGRTTATASNSRNRATRSSAPARVRQDVMKVGEVRTIWAQLPVLAPVTSWIKEMTPEPRGPGSTR